MMLLDDIRRALEHFEQHPVASSLTKGEGRGFIMERGSMGLRVAQPRLDRQSSTTFSVPASRTVDAE